MKMLTSTLPILALNYAVALSEGGTDFRYDTVGTFWITIDGKDRALSTGWAQSYMPTIDSNGDDIIDRELIDTHTIGIVTWPMKWTSPTILCNGIMKSLL